MDKFWKTITFFKSGSDR